MPIVWTNKPKNVKNLGWLLKNISRVTAIAVMKNSNGSGELLALVRHGKERVFHAHFTSYSVLCDFVNTRRYWRTPESEFGNNNSYISSYNVAVLFVPNRDDFKTIRRVWCAEVAKLY